MIRDNPKVMEHVHMPVQSGNNEVLQAMKRLYTRESYLQIIDDLRRTIEGVSITTDVIVGFPGETEEQFEDTLALFDQVRFDGAYMFIYSPRPGTPAGDMDQLPLHVRKARLDRLMELQNTITVERNRAQVGKVFEVLVEGPSPRNPDRLQGYTREYRMMHFEGAADLRGTLVRVEAVDAHMWGLSGRLVS